MSIMTNGLSSRRILDFYKGCDLNNIRNHGLLIKQNGKTLYEHYIYPYSADMPHTLFSVTKSLVSTAVGFAVDEGLIELETKVSPFFRDYEQSKGTENITVRNLLTMHSGKKFSFLQDMTGDYVEIFMKAGFRKDNGFLYSNNDVHILSALLQRITGMTVSDYLMPRLFEPLNIEKPEWETDCKGICVGGTGAYLSLESLVKIVQCYLDGGKFGEKQVIPEYWAKEATRKQVDTDGSSDEGYGYLFWILNDSFRMDGMYGQLVLGFPKLNAVIGYTNCAIDSGPLIGLTEKYLISSFSDPDSAEDNRLLEEFLLSKDEKITSNSYRRSVPDGVFKMNGISKAVSELVFPAVLIPRGISSSMAKRPERSFDRFWFSQSENEITINWYEAGDLVSVKCGLDGKPRVSECSVKGYKYYLWSFGWWEGNTLKVNLKPINTLASLSMAFRFEADGFGLTVNDTPSFTEFILQNLGQVNILEKNKHLKAAAGKIMTLFLGAVNSEMKFKKI